MFQFGRFPAYAYFIQRTLRDSSSRWFPNSDICGSGLICSSPQLFAAYRVLLRLPMPRHSPYALFSLNFMSFANLFYVQSVFVTLLSHCLDLSIFHSLRCSIVTLCVSTLFVNITRFAFSPFVFYSVFKVQLRQLLLSGGLKWARTTDLALIRRTL